MINVAYINFWSQNSANVQDYWFFEFIKKNIDANCILITNLSDNKNIDILIASCFGDINNIKTIDAKIKIFFYGENLNKFEQYKNIKILQDTFDLIVGFKNTNLDEKIIRLPLWITYYPFYFFDDNENILKYLQNSYNANFNLKNKQNQASLVANHDNNGIRTLIMNEVIRYVNVICPGNFNNNTHKIGKACKDKINFIKYTKYNICPENSEFEGYFTEKIFESLEAGCIPVYWAIDKPEKEILNEKCYVWFDTTNIDKTREDIYNMIYNSNKYKNINLFNNEAKNEITKMYNTLKTSILHLLHIKM
jgi:hypothetical protein